MPPFFLPRANFFDREVGVRTVASGARLAEGNDHDDAQWNSLERGSERREERKVPPGGGDGGAESAAAGPVFVTVLVC